jgi:tetratricopeptide (TPR) repeat protein
LGLGKRTVSTKTDAAELLGGGQGMRARLILAVALGLAMALARPTSRALAAENGRYCLRLLVLDSQAEAAALAAGPEPPTAFLRLARQLTPGGQALPPVRCLSAQEMDSQILSLVSGLEEGRVAGPLPMGNKWAVLLVTGEEHRRRGQELAQAKLYAEAEMELRQDAALNPDGPAWQMIAKARAANGDLPGAMQALEQALSWTPDDPALVVAKSLLLLGMGKGDEARESFERALALVPDNPVVLNNLAWVLARQGKSLDRAAVLAQRATQLEPERADFWDTLGLVEQERGHLPQAAANYYRALRLEPELASAKANLLKTLLALDGQTLARLLGQEAPPTRTQARIAP